MVICEACIVHNLQQNIHDISMRLFDFIEQEERVWVLANRLDKKPPFLIAHIARRRTDEFRHAMLFHIFAHIDALKMDTKLTCNLTCKLCLAHACGSSKEKCPNRAIGHIEPSACALERINKTRNCIILPKNALGEIVCKMIQNSGFIAAHIDFRNLRELTNHTFNVAHINHFARIQARQRASLINHINRLIGQKPISDVATRQRNSAFE